MIRLLHIQTVREVVRTVRPRGPRSETWIASRPESAGAQALLRLCGTAGTPVELCPRAPAEYTGRSIERT